jgi:hypothetical protein
MIARLRRWPLLETALLTVAAAALVALGVVTERARHHAVALESYSSYDAAGGGLRAWYEVLRREGLRVDRFEARPPFLNRGIDTLVWAEPLPFDPRRIPNTRADVAALEAWVRDGGRLLYVGRDDAGAAEHALNLPSSALASASANTARFVAPGLSSEGVRDVTPAAELRWRAGGGKTMLFVDEKGPLIVRYAYGKGEVVAVIDESLFTNARLARADDARLAYALARPRIPGGLVAFDEAVHGFIVPEHWWVIVPRPFAVALALATVALLVAFAGAALRLGPPLAPLRRAEQTSSAFIDAVAALFERNGAARKALTDAAASAKRALATAAGVPDDTPDETVARLIESNDARRAFRDLCALAARGRTDDEHLLRGVDLAQRLRKEYVTHGRARG